MSRTTGPAGSRGRAALPPLAIRAWLRWDVVRRHLDAEQPPTVLEIGCGRGAMGARIARRAEYLGLEPDPVSFAAARLAIEAQGGTVLNTTDEDMHPQRAFDLVCAFEVLEHLEDDRAALGNWASWVRPGGHLLISVPAFQRRFAAMDVHAGHYRRYDPAALEHLARLVGLEPRESIVYGWPLGYALEFVRNHIDAVRLRHSPALTKEELTSASGRTFQPSGRASGLAIAIATWPFRYLQRLRPTQGIGIVLLARRPDPDAR